MVPLLLPVVERAYLALARGLSLSFLTFSLAQFVLVLALLLLPTTLMGATLPVLSRLFVTEPGTLGRRVGFALRAQHVRRGRGHRARGLRAAPRARHAGDAHAGRAREPRGRRPDRPRRPASRRAAGSRGGARDRPAAGGERREHGGRAPAAPHPARTGGRRCGLDDLRGRVDARAEPRARQLDLRLHGDADGLPAGSGTGQRDLLAPVRRPPARPRGLRAPAARCRRGSARHPARLRAAARRGRHRASDLALAGLRPVGAGRPRRRRDAGPHAADRRRLPVRRADRRARRRARGP